MSKNIYYITGGAGFIGRHFNSLIKDEHVTNIDLREDKVVSNQVVGDIRHIEDIERSIGDSNIILHLAASHYDFEKDYFETNVGGTKNLLKVASQKEINRIVFFSSVSIYGSSSEPIEENSAPNPENEYGRSKLEAEKLIKSWVKEKEERKAIIIRPAVVFGPHNFGNLFNLTRNIDRGYNIHIGKKPVIKSIAYVENLVEATLFAIENMHDKVQEYNYVDEPQVTNFEISNYIAHVLGQNKSFSVPLSLALVLGHSFDFLSRLTNKEFSISVQRVKKYCTLTHFTASKIFAEGFQPRFTSKSGLIKTTEWYDKNRDVWEVEYEHLKKLFKSNYGITLE